MIPPPPTVTRRLKRIAPLQLGKMAACLYGAMGLIAVPIFLVMSAVMAQMPAPQRGIFALVGVGFAFALPFLYAAIGRNAATCNAYVVVGVIGAAIYNLLARWIGGIEVEVE
jgi:hypothetical protein